MDINKLFQNLLIFGKEVKFSKGYKEFEDMYEELKDEINRKEIEHLGWTEVVLTLKDENNR